MLRIHEKLSIILKTSKKCMRWWFLICKGMHILKVYSIHYTLRQNTNVKKNCFGQNKRYKNALFFLSWAPAHHSFTFNLWFLYKLKYMVRLCKTVCGIFDSVSFLLKFIFLFNKMHGLFDFKTSNSFQNENNKKATHIFAPRPLISKLQEEVSKFNDISVSWSSPKLTLWQIF